MVAVALVAWLCIASPQGAVGADEPRPLVVDAWSVGVVDVAARQVDDFVSGSTGDVAPRAVRFALPAEGSAPAIVEARAAWFDAALIVRDASGASLAQDDDGWYGVHPAVALDAELAARARWIDVVALHGGSGEFTVRIRPGSAEAIAADEVARRVIDESSDLMREARAAPELVDAARFATLRRSAQVLLQAGDADAAVRFAHDVVQLARDVAGDPSAEVRLAIEQLASVQSVAGRLDDARANFEDAHRRAVAEFGADDARIAPTLQRWAHVDLIDGRLAQARERLQLAVDLLSASVGADHLDTLGALELLGQVDAKSGAYGVAEATFRRILDVRTRVLGEDDTRTIDALHNLASTLYGAGDPAAARPLLERALESTERRAQDQPLAVAVTARELAGVLYQLGEYREAEVLAERAYTLFERVLGEDSTQAAGALRDRALIAEVLGDSERARIWFQRCVTIREKVLGPEHPELASDLATLAGLLRRNGSAAGGKPLIERALAIHLAAFGPGHPEVASDHLIAAEIDRDLGDLRGAEQHVQLALAEREAALGPDHAHVAAALVQLAGLLRDQGRTPEARDLYARALAIDLRELGDAHPSTLATMNDLALAEHALGNLDAARALHQRNLEISEATPDRIDLQYAAGSQNLAMLDVDLGRIADARVSGKRGFELAMAALDVVSRQGSEGHRLAQLRRLRWHLAAYLTWCGLEPGHDAEAYEAVLRWKDLAFFASRGTARGSTADVAPMLDLHGELADAVFQDESVDVWSRDRRLARAIEAVVVAESARAIPARPGTGTELLREIGAALRPGSVLVDFVIRADYEPRRPGGAAKRGRHVDPVVTAFVLGHGAVSPRRVELGSAAALRARLDAVLASIALESESDPHDEAWRELESTLLGPLRPYLASATRLYVVPDDFLGDVPWDALTVSPGRFLVEQATVTLVPSASRLAESVESRPIAAEHVLLVGDVAYAGTTDASSVRAGRPAAFAPLPGTAREIELVRTRGAAAAGAATTIRSLVGAEATKHAVRTQVAGARVVHFATHAFARPSGLAAMWEQSIADATVKARDEPNAAVDLLPGLLTGLVFAGANDPSPQHPAQGLLTAAEAAWLPLAECELVVLSACGSARGSTLGGESVASLQRAFHLAGAAAVVSTLWDLDDQAACAWIDAFYEALWTQRMPVAEAARAA
ncbi:MAG: CHAT domain-containing protein, partial [Planctomycetes bacterium]|nr:CHAT domain-containing protein [Planctomycetota bacterium]